MSEQLKVQAERPDGVIEVMYSNSQTGFFCVQIFANRDSLEMHSVRHNMRIVELEGEGYEMP